MSSDSSQSGDDTKVYKLRSKKGFPIWKQKIVSQASSKGFEEYLSKDRKIKTQDELDTLETTYINETDDAKRRIMKGELAKFKRERRRSLAAANLIASNVRDKDLKKLNKCKQDPKKMFDTLVQRYANEEDEDLDDLLDDFKKCKLKSRKIDPEDWYMELDEMNEQLEEIDSDFKKSKKEIAAHILSNLPRGYKTCKAIIKLGDNYLDDLDKIKKQVAKHWKTKHRKRTSRYNSSDSESDSESSSSSSSESEREVRKRKKKDKYALAMVAEKKDTYNQYGLIQCGHCGKPGHGIERCWILHGKPQQYDNNKNNQGGNRPKRRCWYCGSNDHLERNCPKKEQGDDEKEEQEANINSLFIGMMTHQEYIPVDIRDGFEIVPYNAYKECGNEAKKKANEDDDSSFGSWEKLKDEKESINDCNEWRKQMENELKRILKIDASHSEENSALELSDDEDEKVQHTKITTTHNFIGTITLDSENKDSTENELLTIVKKNAKIVERKIEALGYSKLNIEEEIENFVGTITTESENETSKEENKKDEEKESRNENTKKREKINKPSENKDEEAINNRNFHGLGVASTQPSTLDESNSELKTNTKSGKTSKETLDYGDYYFNGRGEK